MCLQKGHSLQHSHLHKNDVLLKGVDPQEDGNGKQGDGDLGAEGTKETNEFKAVDKTDVDTVGKNDVDQGSFGKETRLGQKNVSLELKFSPYELRCVRERAKEREQASERECVCAHVCVSVYKRWIFL